MNEAELYLSGMSITEISNKTGIPLSTIRFRLKKKNILRSRVDAIRLASSQGRLGKGLLGKKRVFTKEWKENISKSRAGVGKGFSLKPSGYIEITMGENKGRPAHAVIMEKIIGRKLMPNECVHHIDHNRSNNSPENLQLMTRESHARHHALENIKNRKRDSKGRLK